MTILSPRDYYGKRVLIFGLGLHGGGVAAAYWFFRYGAEVIVTDVKSRAKLEPSISRLTSLCNEYRLSHYGKKLTSIEYVLGKHREDDVVRSDLIIQNPGVPRDSIFLTVAREHGIPVHNDASILLSLVHRIPIIGVTGTRGKTTTASLIAEMLKHRYARTILAGSIGLPTGSPSIFSYFDKIVEHERKGDDAIVVLELSSWQLEVLGSWGYAPRCAVITNIHPDHLNRYHSMEDYIDAKKNIFRFPRQEDHQYTVVLNADDPIVRTFASEIPTQRKTFWFSRIGRIEGDGCFLEKKQRSSERLMTCSQTEKKQPPFPMTATALLGDHNEENILAAATVAMIHGVAPNQIQQVITTFKGVLGRLEHITTIDGRVFVNDTTATSPDATSAALTTLGGRSKKIVLIAGGSDKNLVFHDLGGDIARWVKSLILFSGTASPHILSAASSAGYSGSIDMVNSMEEAVQKAWKKSEKRDMILLSPASASFGLFVHEFDRGQQFIDAVGRLSHS